MTLCKYEFSSIGDSEFGMEEDSRSVSGFLHFDTVSKGEYYYYYFYFYFYYCC